MARLAVGNVRDRAGVDDVHVGRLGSGDETIPGLHELPRQNAGICLIELAAMSLDGDTWLGYNSQFDGSR